MSVCEDLVETAPLNHTLPRGTDLLRPPLEQWYLTVGIPFVLLLGVPGNLAFLFTLYRVPSMRTTTNLHLANLAVSDFALLIIFSVLALSAYATSPVSNSTISRSWLQCCVIILFIDIPYFASNTIVTLVAFERYYAICRPLRQNASNPRRHIAILAGGWSLSVAFAFSVCLRFSSLVKICVVWPDTDEYMSVSNSVYFCSAGQPWLALYSRGLYSFVWLAGLITNSFFYYKIVRQLGRRHVADARATQTRSVRRSVARMLIVNSIVFFICQAPHTIMFNMLFLIASASGRNNLVAQQITDVWPISVLLTLLNSALNPIIYGVTNSRYRRAFLQAFGCSRMETLNPQSVILTVSSHVSGRDKPVTVDDEGALDQNAENKL